MKRSTSHDILQEFWRWDFGRIPGPVLVWYKSERWLPMSSEDTRVHYFPLAEAASVWSIAADRLAVMPEMWSLYFLLLLGRFSV